MPRLDHLRLGEFPRASRLAPRARHHRHQNHRLADVTAYCTGTTTASGTRVAPGQVATLDRGIAFGTRVTILGRVYTVTDRIGHGSDFDIYMTSCADARRWGRKHVPVELRGNY